MAQKDLLAIDPIAEAPPHHTVFSPLRSLLSGWYGRALCGVLLLSLFLNFFQLGRTGYSNLYYAAAVRSMLISWHNFFFVSFDPNGFVTVDKPPLDLWVQALSAKMFGFSAWSLLLPQALAGVLAVALLAHLVRRSAGPLAGLVAGLTLALMPISVVTNRTNNVDGLLVLLVLCAAWAVIVATERGSLRWLLLGATLVGLGFNIKMLEAYLVLPALALLYLLGAPQRWWVKILHLLVAGGVLLTVSLWWVVVVDLTPATMRPYIGSSGYNSELSLAFGYNGLARVLGFTGLQASFSLQSTQQPLISSAMEAGNPGVLRLFNEHLGPQISWLLPLALAGLIAGIWQRRPRLSQGRYQQGLLLWGVWFLSQAIFFSIASFFHVYYMVMFAPALCALSGIGIATLWHDYARSRWRGWLLVLVLVATAIVQILLLMSFPGWRSLLLLPIIIMMSIAIVLFGMIHFLTRSWVQSMRRLLIVAGLGALLIAPGVFTFFSVIVNYAGAFPVAAPYPPVTAVMRLLGQYEYAGMRPDPAQLRYLIEHQGKADYMLVTGNSIAAAPIIVETGRPVMALGGYAGMDHILTRDQVRQLIQKGRLRFFLFTDSWAFARLPFALQMYFQDQAAEMSTLVGQRSTERWVETNCKLVEPASWGKETYGRGGTLTWNTMYSLYDCAGAS